MSVKLVDYCSNAKSEFAGKLQKLLDEAVLIKSDEIEFDKSEDKTIARIPVYYPLSRYDFEIILRVFEDSYWEIINSTVPSCYVLYIEINESSI